MDRAPDDDTEEKKLITYYEALKRLSSAFGVEPEYMDNWGKIHRTSAETALRILAVKGVVIQPEHLTMSPQVLVVSSDDMPERFSLYLEGLDEVADLEHSVITATLTEVNDHVPEVHFSSEHGEVLLEQDETTGLTSLSLPFFRELEPGTYYPKVACSINDTNLETTCLWIVCPARAYVPSSLREGERIAGVALALYGVRSQTNWGIGDLGDLKRIIDWASDDLNAHVVGLNPLHALFNKRPFNSSPYLPSSRLFQNFIYLEVPSIPDFADSQQALAFVDTPETQARIQALREEEQVNYEEVAWLKIHVLKEMFRTFLERHRKAGSPSDRWTAFQAYRQREGEHLERFATFCALDEHFRATLPNAHTFRDWPHPFQDHRSDDVRRFRQENEDRVLFWMYLQWQVDEQLRNAQEHAARKGMIIGLYHDEALAVDRNGADCWAWPELFHDGFRVGAPPDAFAPDGQDWGFPPPDRDQHRRSGYELFRKQLQVSCRHGGALRIDHVMQLHHLFWIPPNGKPADGIYVKDYEQDLLNIVSLESERNSSLIIGEDLGTVPPDFRERLMEKGVFSYRLFYFERHPDGTMFSHHEYPEWAMVSVTTHDLPTFAGFWSEDDVRTRLQMGQLDEEGARTFSEDRTRHKAKIIERLVEDGFLPAEVAHAAWESPFPTEELHTAVLRFLLHTPSRLAVINQEDIFLDLRQQNFPGTTWEHANWVTKMRYSVEDLRSNPEAVRFSDRFRKVVQEAGRAVKGRG